MIYFFNPFNMQLSKNQYVGTNNNSYFYSCHQIWAISVSSISVPSLLNVCFQNNNINLLWLGWKMLVFRLVFGIFVIILVLSAFVIFKIWIIVYGICIIIMVLGILISRVLVFISRVIILIFRAVVEMYWNKEMFWEMVILILLSLIFVIKVRVLLTLKTPALNVLYKRESKGYFSYNIVRIHTQEHWKSSVILIFIDLRLVRLILLP